MLPGAEPGDPWGGSLPRAWATWRAELLGVDVDARAEGAEAVHVVVALGEDWRVPCGDARSRYESEGGN